MREDMATWLMSSTDGGPKQPDDRSGYGFRRASRDSGHGGEPVRTVRWPAQEAL